jgi:hypothetical protein
MTVVSALDVGKVLLALLLMMERKMQSIADLVPLMDLATAASSSSPLSSAMDCGWDGLDLVLVGCKLDMHK